MKSVLLFSLLSMATATVSASETELYCWGQNTDGENIRFVFDQQQNTVSLEKETVTEEMPPYPYAFQNQWATKTLNYTDGDLNVFGTTTGMTTGIHGKISIVGKATGLSTNFGLKRVFYRATATMTPQVNTVKPVPATVLQINCQTKTKLDSSKVSAD